MADGMGLCFVHYEDGLDSPPANRYELFPIKAFQKK